MSSIEDITNFSKKYNGVDSIRLIHTQLSFDVADINFSSETSPLLISFNAMFNSAIFDICGDCGSDADYGEYWLYEDLSYWNSVGY